MRKKQFPTHLRLLVLLMLLACTLASFSVGKYMQNKDISAKVTFTASLASDFKLQERTATRQPDGSYQLEAPFVTENTYILMPGVDVPKDPHLVILNKTRIKAYLYLIIEETPPADSGITYILASCWVPLEGHTNVYVYSDGLGPVVIDHMTENLDKIDILQTDGNGNAIFVSKDLDKNNNNLNLRFSAALKEIGTVTENGNSRDQTAAEVYGN